jgi:hypothetical protein
MIWIVAISVEVIDRASFTDPVSVRSDWDGTGAGESVESDTREDDLDIFAGEESRLPIGVFLHFVSVESCHAEFTLVLPPARLEEHRGPAMPRVGADLAVINLVYIPIAVSSSHFHACLPRASIVPRVRCEF